jgi:hypothetical protein
MTSKIYVQQKKEEPMIIHQSNFGSNGNIAAGINHGTISVG